MFQRWLVGLRGIGLDIERCECATASDTAANASHKADSSNHEPCPRPPEAQARAALAAAPLLGRSPSRGGVFQSWLGTAKNFGIEVRYAKNSHVQAPEIDFGLS